jgi:hypothetical protein
MERVKLKEQTAQKALQTLEEILEQPYSVIVRDASIQRFEYILMLNDFANSNGSGKSRHGKGWSLQAYSMSGYL